MEPETPEQRSARAKALGREGEHRALRWYRRRGYRVLDRNWRCSSGEIDLVVQRGDVIVFCEVKTRSSRRFGAPAEAVTPAKQARVRRLASAWLATHPTRHRRRRFDIAGVEGRRLAVIEAAF